MVERGARRRSESSAASSLAALAACGGLALAVALGVRPVGAQDRVLSPIDSIRLADSLAQAESLHVQDSLATADSIEAEQEMAETATSFGGARSILDRQRMGRPIVYNSTYTVNRTNTSWGQTMDMMVTRGKLQIGNLTSETFGRETRIGRLNKNRQTQTEFAYRMSTALRMGGHVALTRISDDARVRGNFTGTRQDVDDLAGQARFAHTFGKYPVHFAGSYGYLKNAQLGQSSKGSSFDLYGGTSRSWGDRATLSLDGQTQISRLQSTVDAQPGFLEDDHNTNTSGHLQATAKIANWLTTDGHVSSQRSVLRRPAQIPIDPTDPESTKTVPERIDGVNDEGAAGFHFILPKSASVNLTGSLSRNRQVYVAQQDRSSLVDRKDFTIDAHHTILKTGMNITYDQSVNDNDNTRRDPGYVESTLDRRLEGDAARVLSRRTSARLNLGIYLTRRSYTNFRSAIPGAVAPSDQDQLRARGTLNLQYRPGGWYNTGMTLGYEQNDQVNLSSSASINNAQLRTYTVQWNWDASPGSIWSMNQTNSATAAQQFYTFSSDRDQLSFIYSFNTLITAQLSRQVRFDLTHIVRLQSRGSFRKEADVRRFGKTSDFNTLDLTLREQYQPTSVATFEISQRLAVNPSFNYQRGVSRKISETRRDELNFITRLNYPFNSRANLSGDIRRILATDVSHTYGADASRTSTNTDYWLVTMSFHMEF